MLSSFLSTILLHYSPSFWLINLHVSESIYFPVYCLLYYLFACVPRDVLVCAFPCLPSSLPGSPSRPAGPLVCQLGEASAASSGGRLGVSFLSVTGTNKGRRADCLLTAVCRPLPVKETSISCLLSSLGYCRLECYLPPLCLDRAPVSTSPMCVYLPVRVSSVCFTFMHIYRTANHVPREAACTL